MPRNRPPTSGYARIAQAEEEEEEQPYSDNDNDRDDYFQHPTTTLSTPGPEYAPIHPKRRTDRMHIPSGPSSPGRPRRRRTNSGVDIKAINMRLERWAEEIKERFKIRRVQGKSAEDEHLEIYSSVFQAPDGIRPATKKMLDHEYDDGASRLSKLEFEEQIESVRTAIELGMHPTLISQGSSGSYFARNSAGKVIGVFKPKDEEPYANKNPKWTKWIHRNLFPFAFGRAMLIPNLSYVSEAAAYVLDCQLRTNLVPYTDVVSLSSKSFHHDFWERRAYYRKGKPLPEKLGSFQVFLKGYKGATDFFKEHPWPDHSTRGAQALPKKRRKRRWAEDCRSGSAPAVEEGTDDEGSGLTSREESRTRNEFWTERLQQSFREELEKLVILDYVMRNTDRGTDNWMIRIDKEKNEAQLVIEPPKKLNGHVDGGKANGDADGYLRRNESMTASATHNIGDETTCHVGAIDNSLSFPWKHPDAWRSYPFGWLFLPVSLIGRPFSQNTRTHFLPLLTSKAWWSQTQIKLRECFELDADFQEKMYARQIAVMKGQAWNVVETLKEGDQGPLELTRRGRCVVWDDVVEIPVAVPMVRGSEEMRRAVAATAERGGLAVGGGRGRVGGIEEEEEMDISAALASECTSQNYHDLLGMASPGKEPGRNPFNMSRQSSSQDIDRAARPEGPPSHKVLTPPPDSAKLSPPAPTPRPSHLRSATDRATGGPRLSHEIPRLAWQSPSERKVAERRRRFSFTGGRGWGGGGVRQEHEGDEGDLGYAAVGESEGSRRKVIVERIEVVRGRGPVFTWC